MRNKFSASPSTELLLPMVKFHLTMDKAGKLLKNERFLNRRNAQPAFTVSGCTLFFCQPNICFVELL
jgi:hypothetical protein